MHFNFIERLVIVYESCFHPLVILIAYLVIIQYSLVFVIYHLLLITYHLSFTAYFETFSNISLLIINYAPSVFRIIY